ncbi:T9SS type A sorting domain-containing protein, partial [Candidatus Poribacteria bacterium]|nr:T9SS type A sorting domain-containing protein [Candidatus Poribacteria bacterium]
FMSNAFAQDYTRWHLPEHATLRLGKGGVGDVTFSPDGKRLYADSSVGIWKYDAHTGKELDLIPRNPEYDSYKLNPYAEIYLCLRPDNTVQVRNLIDNSVNVTLKGDFSGLYRIAFSPDGHTFADANEMGIRIWDLTTGEQKTTFVALTDRIHTLEFNADGTMLASVGSGGIFGILRLWDVASATSIKVLSEYVQHIDRLIFSLDGNTLVSATHYSITFWDIASGEKETIRTPPSYRMALSGDGKTLITGGWKGMFLWDFDTQMIRGELSGHKDGIGSITISPDGSTMASSYADELFLWDFESGARKMAIPGHTQGVFSMALSPDGNTLATGNKDEIHLVNPKTSEYKGMLYVDDWYYNTSLAFSPDGNILASKSGEWILLWDIERSLHIATLKDFGEERLSRSNLDSALTYSPDGRFLVSAYDRFTAIHLWAAGRIPAAAFVGHTDGVRTIDISFDGKTLASGSNDNTVKLWDVATRKNTATFNGHSDQVYSVVFNNDASILASGGKDKTIILWDVVTEEPIHLLTGHTDTVNCLAFSKDGGTLVSSGGWYDSTIRLWDVTSGEQKKILKGHTSGVRDILFVHDGSTLISGSGDGTVLFWDVTPFIDTIETTAKLAEDVNRQATKLFPNYPNPFNPETWIPYQLASATDVKVHIYSFDGRLVRTLELGHQQAGVYQSRNKAAYWNGKNEFGERVASGIYYYTLFAGKFTATRRMVILK